MFLELRFIKKGNSIVYIYPSDEVLYNKTIKELPEGTRLTAMFEMSSQDGTMGQLAKLHACIRQLALHLGYDFVDMKTYIKSISGFITTKLIAGKEISRIKSFGDCSKEELGFAIQMCIQFGQTVNCPL